MIATQSDGAICAMSIPSAREVDEEMERLSLKSGNEKLDGERQRLGQTSGRARPDVQKTI